MRSLERTVAIVVLAFVATGCQRKQSPPVRVDAAPAVVAPATSHAAAPIGADAHAPELLSGKVLETMDASGYTYLRIGAKDGERWAAVQKAKIEVGQTVSVAIATVMRDFESKTLSRKFDSIVFGNLTAGTDAQPPTNASDAKGADSTNALFAAHAAAASGLGSAGDVRVPKATGADARTIAELFAQRAALKDTTVTIRAKVVKASPGILKRNWIHVRDGSGSSQGKDNDLTVTTREAAAVGDVVTVKGTLHLDRDIGAGYVYPLIVEDATVSR